MDADQLSKLRCVSSFALPGEFPACLVHDDRFVYRDDSGVTVLDLATGAVHRRIPIEGVASIRHLVDGYVIQVPDSATPAASRLIHVPHDSNVPTAVRHVPAYVKSWSRTGEVALFHDGTLEVKRWPSLELVHSIVGYHPTVDWENRLLLVSDSDNHRHIVEAIDVVDGQRERHHVDYDERGEQHFYVVGNGVADCDFGATLVGYRKGWRTRLSSSPLEGGSLFLEVTADSFAPCSAIDRVGSISTSRPAGS